MLDEPKDIQVELRNDGQVEVIAHQSLSDHDWLRVTNFGKPQDTLGTGGRTFTISVSLLDAHLSWFRDVWEASGKTQELSTAVVEGIKANRTTVSQFESLESLNPHRHSGHHIEIPGLTKILTREQKENVLCLLDMKNGANFSVPGAGKTLTEMSVWAHLRTTSKVQKMLVICPRAAFSAWEAEASQSFSPKFSVGRFDGNFIDSDADLIVVNYERLENAERLEYLKDWVRRNQALVVVDEAHRIKSGGKSVRWRAVKELSQNAVRVDLLTGTPMPQGVEDLRALYSASWPELGKQTLSDSRLISMKRKTTFVRTTKEELGLPDVKPKIVTDEPTPLHGAILSALRDQYSGSYGVSIAETKHFARKGKAIMTLLAGASNPGLLVRKDFSSIEMGFGWPPLEVQANATLMELVEDYLNHETPWKFRYIALRLEELARNNQKLIVWSSFVGNIAALKRVLTKFKPAVVYGGISNEERESEIQRFRKQSDCYVLITNPQTLGEGISLHQECHEAIYVDRTYNAGLYLQSLDRIHRLGLPPETETTITILSTKNSIDERVSRRLDLKIARLASFLQDPGLTATALPSTDELAPQDALGLTDEDIDDVFRYWSR